MLRGAIDIGKALRNTVKFFVITFVQTWLCYLSIIIFGLNAKERPGMVLLRDGVVPSEKGRRRKRRR